MTRLYSSNLTHLAYEIYKWAKEKGFVDPELNVDQKLLLIVGEISEAHDELRSGRNRTEFYKEESGKPAGFGIELADAIIRLLELSAQCGLDIGWLVEEKMKFNETRPYKHGRKF